MLQVLQRQTMQLKEACIIITSKMHSTISKCKIFHLRNLVWKSEVIKPRIKSSKDKMKKKLLQILV